MQPAVIDLPPDLTLVLETPRLRVIPLAVDDTHDLYVVLNDDRLYTFTGGHPPTEEELDTRLTRWRQRRSPDGHEIWLNWVIRLVPAGEAIGYVQVTVREEHTAVIAYVVGADYWRRGFAREATGAVAAALRTHLGVEELRAHIHPAHAASQHVAEHLGMRRTGTVDAAGEEVWSTATHPATAG